MAFVRVAILGRRGSLLSQRRICITSAATSSTSPSLNPTSAPDLTHRAFATVSTGSNPLKDDGGKVILKSLTREELEVFVQSLGEKPFRAKQLWQWMYSPASLVGTFDEMTNLSKAFREKLNEVARIDCLRVNTSHVAKDGTRKITFQLDDGGIIESVWIPSVPSEEDDDDIPFVPSKKGGTSPTSKPTERKKRVTLCVSSQLGCALNCQFCFTAKMGLRRHLTMAEIVDQVILSKRFFDTEDYKVTNVVFMGMGEPLHNVDNVLQATDVLISSHGLALSHNKVTVSTSGLVPQMKRFLTESKANLAVSLNATTDEVRNWIMPINRKYDLEELLGTLRKCVPKRDDGKAVKKVLFEYVMLRGVNDSLEDAKRIVKLTHGIPCKINLIHFNSHTGSEFEPSPKAQMEEFRRYLSSKGMVVTIRQSRGDDEMAACGQLGKPGDRPSPPRMRVPAKYEQAIKINNIKEASAAE